MLVKHVVYEFTPGRLDITVILLCQKDLDSSLLTQAAQSNPDKLRYTRLIQQTEHLDLMLQLKKPAEIHTTEKARKHFLSMVIKSLLVYSIDNIHSKMCDMSCD